MKEHGCDGLLAIDKPIGVSSRAVVDRAQRWFPRGTRVGHTGTLDPLATGVLVLAVGLATRLTEYVQHMAKKYEAGILLGATSNTDDAEGQIVAASPATSPTRDDLIKAFAGLTGEIDQVPPAYSAARVSGRRAYDLARKGHDVTLASRRVVVHGIDLLRYEYPHVEIRVRCGKGTYIRSLARDVGQALGCGGYIGSLRRTEVGCFHADDACGLDVDPTLVRERLLPLSWAVRDLPKITLPPAEANRLVHGQRLKPPPDWPAHAKEVAVLDPGGRLLAVVSLDEGLVRPDKVFVEVNGRQLDTC